MSVTLSLPFERGTTGYAGRTPDASNLLFANQLGQVRVVPDVDPDTGEQYSGLQVTVMLMRNTKGSALIPGELFTFSATNYANADGLAKGNVFFGVVDEYLPSAGVPDDDVFWGVIKGPTTADMTALGSALTAGQVVMIPSASTAGELDQVDTTPADATAAQMNAIYGTAVTMGALGKGATSGRVCLTGNWLGQ